MRYNTVTACERCGKTARCVWATTAPFEGVWLCLECAGVTGSPADRLADLVKADEKIRRAADAAGVDRAIVPHRPNE